MNIETEFPARYWINLARRQDRRVETEYQLDKAGFTAERFPAVDARFVRKNRGYESAGRYALALSQRLVIRKAKLAKADAVLVLEDDVVFHPDLAARLAEMSMPDDWGIFYLGCAHRRHPWPAGWGMVRTSYALDTHAFAVRAPYYDRVMAALARKADEPSLHARASDWFLANLHKDIPTYACYPNLAWQAVANSDLAGGVYSNYTPSGEQIASNGEIYGLQGEMWGAERWQSWNRVEFVEEQSAEIIFRPVNMPDSPAIPVLETKPPRLGLLFLTRGDVNHPGIWSEFVQDAGDDVKIFSHSKDEAAAQSGFLAGSAIGDRHETAWGDISLVRVMISLLKAALADEGLTHFAFVSESCIPIRPWTEMKRRLKIDPRSMLDYETAPEMKPKHLDRISRVRDVPERCKRMHSQWCLLDREAATCVTEVDLTRHFEGITAADEHYIGTTLALRGYDEGRRIRREPTTWVKWRDHDWGSRPVEIKDTTPCFAAELACFPGFFARKFAEDSDIGKWNLHRP